MYCLYFICERKFYAPTHVKKLRDTGNQPLHLFIRDLSEISRVGGGVETEGGSQLFETAEKGGVMKNGPLLNHRSSRNQRDPDDTGL